MFVARREDAERTRAAWGTFTQRLWRYDTPVSAIPISNRCFSLTQVQSTNEIPPLLFPALLAQPVSAQVVVRAANAMLQPQIGRDADVFSVCGIRALVLDEKPKHVEICDFSVNLRA